MNYDASQMGSKPKAMIAVHFEFACALDIMRMHPELMHGERFLDDRHIWCSENRVITGNFLISSQARADSKYCTVLYWMSNDEN